MEILQVNNVSIKYITGDFKSIGLKEYVMRRLKGNYTVKEFWANKNISFNLEEGDMLGIIGTNGAGKSTLLNAPIGRNNNAPRNDSSTIGTWKRV